MSNNIDNIRTALDAGKELAAIEARIGDLSHPEHAEVSVPVALVQKDGVTRVEMITDALAELDRRLTGPRRRTGIAKLTEVESFIAHVLRWGDPKRSTIYADTAAMSFTAVLDDHPPTPAPTDTAWREHRATYSCPRSAEWREWTARDGRAMRQTEFADFLESRLEDLVAADGAPAPLEVLKMARQLTIKTKGTFQREVNPTTGDFVLVNKTETEQGSTEIPRMFVIALPVFEGGVRYQIEARVRFTLADGTPQFAFVLHRRAEIERDAFSAIRQQVAEATKLQVFAGSP